MKTKILHIYLSILIIISVFVFSGLFFRSNIVSNKWNALEINGQINEMVHIGKNIFFKLDTFWFAVLYNPSVYKENLIGCKFQKESKSDYYYIICPDTLLKVWSGGGAVVDDKILLRRIDMALQKKENQLE